jgi:hypothetical protein
MATHEFDLGLIAVVIDKANAVEVTTGVERVHNTVIDCLGCVVRCHVIRNDINHKIL